MAGGHKDGGGFIGTSNDGGGGGWENLRLWSTNAWNGITGKNSRENAKKAAKAAEAKRRDSIVRAFGMQQQADSMAYASAMSNANQGGSGGRNDSPGLVGTGIGEGTIGGNIQKTSGTF